MPPDKGITINRVFLVPEFNKKIISIPQLVEQGYKVCFSSNGSKIFFPNGSILTVPQLPDGLFYIVPEPSPIVAHTTNTVTSVLHQPSFVHGQKCVCSA